MATSAPGTAAVGDGTTSDRTTTDRTTTDRLTEGATGDEPAEPRRRRPARRLSADQRRAELLEAAVVEFAKNGYHGTRTADIAARAGVSQPYVYALFPDKRSLFLACHDWTTERIKESLEKTATDSGDGEDLEQILDRAYQTLFEEHPHQVLFQIQAHAAATADPVIRAPVRQRFIELIELSERLHDAPRDLVLRHVARSMLGNVVLALDLPPEYRPAV
jgi:AcrR family transcriptional regulator